MAPAPKGNTYWKLADPEKIGRDPKFDSPKELWNECVEYFQWIDDNPLIQEEHTTSGTTISTKEKRYAKPYTWEGLYAFLGVCNLDHYKTKKEFSGIISHISNIIYSNKFEGASAGLFNSNIIARDLGLKDQKEIDTKVSLFDALTEENESNNQESE